MDIASDLLIGVITLVAALGGVFLGHRFQSQRDVKEYDRRRQDAADDIERTTLMDMIGACGELRKALATIGVRSNHFKQHQQFQGVAVPEKDLIAFEEAKSGFITAYSTLKSDELAQKAAKAVQASYDALISLATDELNELSQPFTIAQYNIQSVAAWARLMYHGRAELIDWDRPPVTITPMSNHPLEQLLREGKLRAHRPTEETPDAELSMHAVLPVAASSNAETEGYQSLHKEAVGVARQTISDHDAGIRAWHAAMTLTLKSLGGTHAFAGNETMRASRVLRYSFIQGAMLTSKSALETCLSGHYSESMSMCRFLMESWIRIAYLDLQPDAAKKWFKHETWGPEPVDDNPMLKRLRNDPKHNKNAEIVWKLIEDANNYAHPSPLTIGGIHGRLQRGGTLGPIYSQGMAARCIHNAATSCILIAREIPNVISVDQAFGDALEQAAQQMEEWERLNTSQQSSEDEPG